MHKSAWSFVVFALLLTACTIQVTTFQPSPTSTSSPIDILATQVSMQPTPTPLVVLQPTASPSTATGGMLYFWPAFVPPEMKFNSVRSLSSEDGYVIEFSDPQTGTAMVLRTGTEADRYPYCAGQTSPYQIRGVEGCSSMGTGAGAGLEWKENGVHYSLGGIGNSLETVIQFAGNLEVIDYQTWQQKFAEAAAMSSP